MGMSRSEVSEFVAAAMRLRGYPFLERIGEIEERILVNAAELEMLHSAHEVEEPPLFSQRVVPDRKVTDDRFAYSGHSPGTELCFASATHIARAVQAKQVSPVDVAKAFIDRIEKNRNLNAFITFRPDQVLAEAKELQQRRQRETGIGPLAGVPCAVKDIMQVRGYPMTGGSKATDGGIATHDAEAISRLRSAGALIIGTTNLHELAYGITSINPHFGTVGNPHRQGHIAGGSSGGSASAVAAGLAAVAVGTDTGGSIRIPAACCGVVGLKPTYDAISREGLMPFAWTLDHVGPIARTVEDAAMLFEVLAGREIGSTLGNAKSAVRFAIGRLRDPYFSRMDTPVQKCVEKALTLLREDGCEILDAAVRNVEIAPAIQFATIASEALQSNWERLMFRGNDLGADVRVRLETGFCLLAADYIKAQRLRNDLRNQFVLAMDRCDVLACATLMTTAPRVGESSVRVRDSTIPLQTAITRYAGLFNSTGLPAITIPCGVDSLGLPIGIQFVGRPGDERSVLRVALQCERLLKESGEWQVRVVPA